MKTGRLICFKDYPPQPMAARGIAGRGLTFVEVFGMLPESRTETTTLTKL